MLLLEPPPPPLSEFSQGSRMPLSVCSARTKQRPYIFVSVCCIWNYFHLFAREMLRVYVRPRRGALISRRNAWLLHVGIPNIDKCRTLPAWQATKAFRSLFVLLFLRDGKKHAEICVLSLSLLGLDGCLFKGKREEKWKLSEWRKDMRRILQMCVWGLLSPFQRSQIIHLHPTMFFWKVSQRIIHIKASTFGYHSVFNTSWREGKKYFLQL